MLKGLGYYFLGLSGERGEVGVGVEVDGGVEEGRGEEGFELGGLLDFGKALDEKDIDIVEAQRGVRGGLLVEVS